MKGRVGQESKDFDEKLSRLVLPVILPSLLLVAWLCWLLLTPSHQAIQIDNSQTPVATYKVERYNALVAAFAFVGVITAIILQSLELRLQRKELEQTREELRGQKEMLAQQAELMRLETFETQLRALAKNVSDSIDNVRTVEYRTRRGEDRSVVHNGPGALFNEICGYSVKGGSLDEVTRSFILEHPHGLPSFFLGPIQSMVVYLDYLCEYLPPPSVGSTFERRGRYLSQLFARLHPTATVMLYLYLQGLDEYPTKVMSRNQRDMLYSHNVFRFALKETGLSHSQVQELQEESVEQMKASEAWQNYQSQLKQSVP